MIKKIRLHRYVYIILSLLLLICSAVVSYASSDPQIAADRLQGFGVVKGTDTGLDLLGGLSREQALVLFIRTLGEEDDAKKLAGIGSSFIDVKRTSWFSPYVFYAQSKGYTKGVGGGKFGAGAPVSNQEFMAFMLRGLGYEVPFDQVMTLAKALNLFSGVTESPYHYLNRGEAFLILNQVLDTPMNGLSQPLYQTLVGINSDSASEGSRTTSAILGVESIDTTAIKIEFDSKVEPLLSEFELVSTAGQVVPLIRLQTISDENVVVLTTTKMAVGQIYTLRYKAQSFSVVPIALANLDYPRVRAVKAITQTQLRVTLGTTMVQRSSIAIENFTIDGGVSVNDVSLDLVQMGMPVNANKLILAVSVTPLTEGKSYSLTIKGLKSYKGFSGNSTVVFESASLDKSAPKIISVTALASDQLKLILEDQTSLDPLSIKQENFSIAPSLNVRNATLTPSMVPGQYVVYVLTDHQKADMQYELSATRLTDGENIMQGAQRFSFFGKGRLLNLKPLYATAKALDVIEVGFSSEVHVESLVEEHFVLSDGFTVNSVSYAQNPMLPGGIDKRAIWLKTQGLAKEKTIKVLLLKSLKDADGQGMVEDQLYYVSGVIPDNTFGYGIEASAIDDMTCRVLFTDDLDIVSAQDFRNYYAVGLGYAAKAVVDQDMHTVYLTFPTIPKGQVTTLIINGIKDRSGNQITPNTKTYFMMP